MSASSVRCPTCGLHVYDSHTTLCPKCHDWLPSSKLPDAISAPKRRPFEWRLAGRIALVVLAVLTVGPLSCLLVGAVLQPRREPAVSSPTPVTAVQPAPVVAPPQPTALTFADDIELAYWRFGRPDVDDTTATDVPRPPIVTRWLVYSRERVHISYVADCNFGDPPPYRGWRILGCSDPSTNQHLDLEEAIRRLAGRDKGPPP